MIGIPGSGKSTVAEKMSKEKGIPILESDKKRAELKTELERNPKSQEVFDALAKEAF
jgi:adenylate kinase family enzyme